MVRLSVEVLGFQTVGPCHELTEVSHTVCTPLVRLDSLVPQLAFLIEESLGGLPVVRGPRRPRLDATDDELDGGTLGGRCNHVWSPDWVIIDYRYYRDARAACNRKLC